MASQGDVYGESERQGSGGVTRSGRAGSEHVSRGSNLQADGRVLPPAAFACGDQELQVCYLAGWGSFGLWLVQVPSPHKAQE